MWARTYGSILQFLWALNFRRSADCTIGQSYCSLLPLLNAAAEAREH